MCRRERERERVEVCGVDTYRGGEMEVIVVVKLASKYTNLGLTRAR